MEFPIVKDFRSCSNNRIGAGADEFHRSGGNGFRPFRHAAHHEHGFSQRWRLFLNTAAVRKDEIAQRKHVNKLQIIEGFDQFDIRMAVKLPEYRADIRIEVNRKNNLYIVALRQAAQGGANIAESFPKALAPVARNQNHFLVRIEE